MAAELLTERQPGSSLDYLVSIAEQGEGSPSPSSTR
jgi:hypothetical protein